MTFKKLTLSNFRQFYGTQQLRFSDSTDKNVTVFYGLNGSGKTALLNAFTWVLYGIVDFERPNELINERLVAEAETNEPLEAYVELNFHHNGKDYLLRRQAFGTKKEGMEYQKKQDSGPIMQVIDEQGHATKDSTPLQTINQILPEKMCSYFFFNGERIEKLGKRAASKDITKAIKNIMGVEIIERAIKHVGTARKKVFEKEFGEYGSEEAKILMAKKKEFQAEDEHLEESILSNENKIEQFREDKEVKVEKLRKLKETEAQQKKRDDLEARQGLVVKEIETIDKDIRLKASQNGFLSYSKTIIDKSETMLNDKREKGEIPSAIKKQFVEDLLDSGSCICKRPLRPGEEPYKEVEKWRDKARLAEIEDAFIRTSAQIEKMRAARAGFLKDLKDQRTNRGNYGAELESIRKKLSALSDEIKEGGGDARKTEEELDRLDESIGDLQEANGSLREKKRVVNERMSEIDSEVKRNKAAQGKAAIAQKRIAASLECENALIEILDAIKETVRVRLSKRVGDSFDKIIRMDYAASITQDYTLQILNRFNQPVATSTGESQVASLSFIGSLVDLAREQYKKKGSVFFKGGIYPIVMDSPFGSLDDQYRKMIGEIVPMLAEQVTLMASPSQWNGNVAEAMGKHVGRHYGVIRYTNKKDIQDDKLKLNGKKFALIRPADDQEYTMIEELS